MYITETDAKLIFTTRTTHVFFVSALSEVLKMYQNFEHNRLTKQTEIEL